MNKILKTVVGAACVTFACTPGVKATGQQNMLHEEYMKVLSGEQPVQVFITSQLMPREARAQAFFDHHQEFIDRLGKKLLPGSESSDDEREESKDDLCSIGRRDIDRLEAQMREVKGDVVDLYSLVKQMALSVESSQETQNADFVQKLDELKNILGEEKNGMSIIKRLSVIQNILERIARFAR